MFDKLFDKMDHVLDEKPTVTTPETIVQAAIRNEDGKVWTGPDHGTIINKMEDAGFGFVRYAGSTATSYPEIEDGFVTSTGRFVSREEATAIAKKADQIKHPRGILTHDQLESIDQLK